MLLVCRRDELGYHIITIRGSAMAYVAFVLVIVYCFKSFTIIIFKKCSNFSEYPLYIYICVYIYTYIYTHTHIYIFLI